MRTKLLSLGLLWLVLAQVMVALNIVVSKSLLTNIPVLVLMTIRFGIATFILLPLHWLSPQRKISISTHFAKVTTKDWFFLIAQALCAGILFNFLMLNGLERTDANVAGIITSALPAMIAIFSWIFLKEDLSIKKGICILLATSGLLVIAFDKFTTIGEAHSFIGDMIVLFALVPEAAYYILTKLHKSELSVFLTSSLLNGINTLLLLPVAYHHYGNFFTLISGHWLILIILGISAGLFYVFWLFGSQQVDGVMASLSTALMPIMTVLIAWWLLHEGLNIHQTLGLTLVLSSILIYARD